MLGTGLVMMSDLVSAAPGDLVRCLVRQSGGRVSPSVHVCRVDHRYGPRHDLLHVQALCGKTVGMAVVPFGDERECRLCTATAERWERFR